MNPDDLALDDEPGLQGKVLYIEDQAVSREVVGALLAKHPGIVYLTAETGAEGIRRVREEHPDWVLLDMHLPDMSGLHVVRELNPFIAERGLRVTILTADTLSMDILKAMSLGAFEHWVKPFGAQAFDAGLRRALGAAARRSRPGG
jgi:hypothetical protein